MIIRIEVTKREIIRFYAKRGFLLDNALINMIVVSEIPINLWVKLFERYTSKRKTRVIVSEDFLEALGNE